MSQIRKELLAHKQQALVEYIDRHPDKGERILEQIEAMGVNRIFEDFEVTMERYKRIQDATDSEQRAFHPPAFLNSQKFKAVTSDALTQELTLEMGNNPKPAVLLRAKDMTTETRNVFYNTGLSMLKNGQVGIVLMAGGQGTRLKFDGPKGCYKLADLPGKPTVFQVLLQRLTALIKLSGASIPLYVMVSHQNAVATEAHFRENNFYGLCPDDVCFFEQTVMPSFSEDGQVLLEDPGSVTRNPNGNGGLFDSLERTGQLANMRKRGVECIHVIGVDNILVKLGCPLFLGACKLAGVAVGNKCVTKRDPQEKVGVQGYSSGSKGSRPCVLEYTEISSEQAAALADPKDPGRGLLFSAANIVNHYFTLDHIQSLLQSSSFEYHIALKNLKSFDPVTESPTTIKGVKLEYFIFDAFFSAKCVLALETERSEEFSPVKNYAGIDSPQTATTDILNLHKKYLETAGISAPEGCLIGLDKTYQGENLKEHAGSSVDELVKLGVLLIP
eukprot:Protomagalhaensia_sp_Gyna_25__1284@NODE_1643_length_1667_cov_162_865479_g1343_i0_p1_GENE_NODE_1643_length_1667_cov_162_865479_g1343_i0NODE_1643_length_1667_cov_162_865479_g1343_i0_p1_ORF_typecomplete_len501_score72_52UDPGP/PF01704_18/3_3e83NTP_transf_3/PF12804_7/0_02IspD/PF01128_19/0_24NTP_transferase/PF00483_23/0_3_NODE_1643_length_1667_cov_162_865479_g1343_i0611563